MIKTINKNFRKEYKLTYIYKKHLLQKKLKIQMFNASIKKNLYAKRTSNVRHLQSAINAPVISEDVHFSAAPRISSGSVDAAPRISSGSVDAAPRISSGSAAPRISSGSAAPRISPGSADAAL
jgi:hypothetical protein